MISALLATTLTARAEAPKRLRVSDDRRALVREDGRPFFWLGDTAWMLFQRLDREHTERYLQDRASKGFTVIQAVAVTDTEGGPNAYGESALHERDPRRPNDAYFAHMDWVIRRANALGLVVALLPTWGDAWNPQGSDPPAYLDASNAAWFGHWLGRRYRDADLVWVLGGDRRIDDARQLEIVRALARGLKRGDGGAHLMTFHPPGGHGSSRWLHAEPWLDFNMRQNGHDAEFKQYAFTRQDYGRKPTKPVLDGEPLYEDHPLSFQQANFGHSGSSDVRRALYWDLFGGAFGHTYGHHSVWQFYAPERKPLNDPLLPWTEALAQPGAAQMQHARQLLESRPAARIPDDTLLVSERVTTAMPGAGRYRFVATRERAGSWAMVYAPLGRKFRVRTDALSGERLRAWWFDPRSGAATPIGSLPREPELAFTPPVAGEAVDWVLVLDDAAKNYPPPGRQR